MPEAAKRLSVGVQSVYNWIKDNHITYYQIGGHYRIPVKAVEDLLSNGIHLAKGKE